jgi:hypothetical protein
MLIIKYAAASHAGLMGGLCAYPCSIRATLFLILIPKLNSMRDSLTGRGMDGFSMELKVIDPDHMEVELKISVVFTQAPETQLGVELLH